MNNQKEYLVQQEFVKEFFKSVAELPQDALDAYLHRSAERISKAEGEPHTVKELLNTVGEGNGKLAIHFAASRGDLSILKYLIAQGADPQVKDDLNNSILIIAVEHQRKEIIQYLLDELHFDANEKRGLISVLHQAAQSGNIPIVELLLSHGAQIDAESQYGTPLLFAAATNQNWVCVHLLKKGADPNIRSSHMPPILHLAIDQNNIELFIILVVEFKQKTDFNIKDEAGWSSLQLCAERNRPDMMKTLLELGADVDYENQGQTALDVAVQHGSWSCAELVRQLARRKEAQPAPQVEKLTPDQQEQLLSKVMDIKQRGNDLFAEKQYPEALALYQEALTASMPIRSTYPVQITPICTNVAACYMQLQQYKEILEVCRLAREMNYKWVKIYYFEGHAYEALGDFGEAAVSYFDALKVDSNQIFKKLFDEAISKGKAAYKAKV